MASFLQRKIERMMELTLPERCQLEVLQRDYRVIKRGTAAWRQGDRVDTHYVVLEGWAFLCAELPSGTRQIINLRIPGDIITPIHPRAWYSVRALTRMRLAPVNLDAVLHMSRHHPRLLATLVWLAAHEEVMFCEQIIRLGRRSAYVRIAHLLVELYLRCQWVGLAGSGAFVLPLTQEQMADALGLSVVHANRRMRQLAAEGLIEIGRSRIQIQDLEGLARVSGFDMETFGSLCVPAEIQSLAS